MRQHNGTTLTDQELDETINRLEKRLIRHPNNGELAQRLLNILDCRVPTIRGDGAYSRCQLALSSRFKNNGLSAKHFDTDFLMSSVNDYRSIISQFNINGKLAIRQIYEGELHQIKGQIPSCQSLLSFFNKRSVICGICYQCYKVQITPTNLVDLIKLSVLFKFIKLDRDNSRKCMIETRQGIDNPYKGYIYCESEEEAINCIETLRTNMKDFGLPNIYCGISHGCSEYSLKYPEFKFSKDGANRAQNQPYAWREMEENFYQEPEPAQAQILNASTPEISLRDVICFETWIKYSEMIGDPAHERFLPVSADGKLQGFTDVVARQAHIRKAQLVAVRQRQSD